MSAMLTTAVVPFSQDGHAAALEDEAQCLVGGTSEKFVPEPMGEDITADLINGLRRFKDAENK